jgi:NAD+ diphosphatase
MRNDNALWFVFYDQKLLLLPGKKGAEALPREKETPFAGQAGTMTPRVHALGAHEGLPCFAFTLESLPHEAAADHALTALRASYDILGESLYTLAGKGAELIHWDGQTRFCPACGSRTVPGLPLSKKCPACGNELFPNIAVAAIVLVRKGDAALLIRAHNFRGTSHGLVAGFLEPGETLEECAAREVLEETGLIADNIRYFGCQPWPYPSGLMVGFTADYKSGEIRLQTEELSSAAFFRKDALPELPAKLSLARRLIDAWLAEGRS